MKKLVLLAFLIGIGYFSFAQMTLSSGSQIVVASGSTIVANDVVNNSGTIVNSGNVEIKGDLTNNNGGLIDNTSSGTVTFNGSSAQEITGAATTHFYGALEIDNTSGVSLTSTSTGADQEVHGTMTFTNGKLTLNGFDLTLDGTGDPTGVGSTSYFVTNSTGELKRTVGANNILFPVGNTAYNPITINNAGTSDTYGVIAVDNEPANSSTDHLVDRSWVVTEASAGNSNLTVTAQWNASEELTDFDRTNSAVGLTTDAGSSYTWGSYGGASGSDPYTQSGAGFTGVGTYAVGDYYADAIVVNLTAFLGGAYNTTNSNMDKTLNTEGLIPTTDPYSLSTTVSSVPSSAVDWIKVELRDKNDNTSVLYSFARFIDQDGQIIEEDESNFTMKGVPEDSYYIAVMHRNHFGVISNATVDLSSSPTLSFTSNQATAYQDGTISTNAAMKEVETGVFGLWNGDANGDGTISYNGASNDRITVLNKVGASTPGNTIANTYTDEDVNMDSDVNYNGAGNDRINILNVIGAITPGVVYTEHIPE